MQCYGAEDDKTFGIPGEVTTHHSLCISRTVVVLVSLSVHLSISPSTDPLVCSCLTKFQYSLLILNSVGLYYFDSII